jgi:Cu-Zn family superoxide dismutase
MKVDLTADDLKETRRAKATLAGDGISGSATFIEYQIDDFYYVKVVIDLKGDPTKLVAGKHAVHIHEKGDLGEDGHDFKCAGGHFDPGPAGNGDPDVNHPFHSGDLPNITVDESGVGHLEALTSRITLSSGPRSILGTADGTSLMIHGNPDPYEGGASGSGISGGPRVAAGIIEAA